MKVRIKQRPSGLINGRYWPRVGETIELPDNVAIGMLRAKQVEPAPDDPEEARPADTSAVEISRPVDTGTEPAPTPPADTGTEPAPTPPADAGKVETATPRKGRASAVVKPAAGATPDAGTADTAGKAGATPDDKA